MTDALKASLYANFIELVISLALFALAYFAIACLILAYQLMTGIQPWPPKREPRVRIKNGKWEIVE